MNVAIVSRNSPTEVEDEYPLSPLQQGMLFHSVLEKGTGIDIQQLLCDLDENLDDAALRRAWQSLVARHSVLRTRFRWEGVDEPSQEVLAQVVLPWEQLDWRGVAAGEREQRFIELLSTDRRRGFDLSQAPLMRVTLVRCSDTETRLVWTFCHAVVDGRSLAPLLREAFTLYEGLRRGQDVELQSARPYRAHVAWLQQQDFSKAEGFWRTALKGFTAPTPLLFDRAPATGEGPSDRRGAHEVRLSTTLTVALRSLAQEHQLTLNTLVQGAWSLLLSRASGEEEVVFGATRACRKSTIEGADAIAGLFINTLPVRVRVDPGAPLVPWLKGVRAQWTGMREYEHTPLVKVQSWSDLPPGTSLFDSILVFESFHLDSALRGQGGAWSNRRFRLLSQPSYPLMLEAFAATEIHLRIVFDRRRFDDATVVSMLGHVRMLLEGMVDGPDRALGQLAMLTEAESRQLRAWNDTQTAYPRERCVDELFEEQAQKTPERVALVLEPEHLSYAELSRRANQLAAQLRSLGVGPGVRVGLCLERSFEMVVALLGVLKAGGAYVPLDPAFPRDRLAHMVEDAKPLVLLTQRRLLAELPPHQAQVVCLDSEVGPAPAVSGKQSAAGKRQATDTAYVLYTSGSTGKPKGVQISHRALVNFLCSMQMEPGLGADDTLLAVTTLSFDIAGLELFLPLISGAKVVLATSKTASDGPQLLKLMEGCSATVMQATPATWRLLLEAGWKATPGLKILCGGEAWSTELADELLQRCDSLWNMYGPTETTVWSAVSRVEPGKPVRIGPPIANTTLHVVDGSGRETPIGVAGELLIGGDGVADGYLNRPELTADRFIADPFGPGDRLYKTGDLVRWTRAGDLEFLGRKDHQVKIRGYRIELGDIEAALKLHPDVREAVVVAREDTPGDKRLVAYMTPAAPGPALVGELRSLLKEKLPSYMTPSAFVFLETLPLTPNKKIDRKALPAPEATGKDGGDGAHTPPSTEMERALAEIWCEVLKVKRVGIQDNFFELGGHSLMAARLVSRIQQVLHAELPLPTLFEHPTIAGIASVISQSGSTSWIESDQAGPSTSPAGVVGDGGQPGSPDSPPRPGLPGAHEIYRFLALSDHWAARAARLVRRGVRHISVPTPRIVAIPLLYAFIGSRAVYFFVKRVFICEPLFKAYCKQYGRRLRTDVYIPWIEGKGDIIVGDDVHIDGMCSIIFAARFSERPALIVGDNTGWGHGCTFTVGKRITIGRDCMIASGVWMFDSSGHAVEPEARRAGKPPAVDEVQPITIGDNVWIGRDATIYPGVTIGNNSVISTGAAVMSDVLPDSVVAGNPARTIRRFSGQKRPEVS